MEGKQLDMLLKEMYKVALFKVYQNSGLIEVKKQIKYALDCVEGDSSVSRTSLISISNELEALSYLVEVKEFNAADYPVAATWLREIANELDKLSSTGVGQA